MHESLGTLGRGLPSTRGRRALRLYTDGACIGNKNVANSNCPSGWGVVAVLESHKEDRIPSGRVHHTFSSSAEPVHLLDLCGPVELRPDHERYLGAERGSNNTAELSAIGEALRAIVDLCANINLRFPPDTPLCFDEVVIYYDSEYAAKSTTGEFNGKKNAAMISKVRQLYVSAKEALRCLFQGRRAGGAKDVSSNYPSGLLLPGYLECVLAEKSPAQTPSARLRFQHVKGHSGDVWNDRADRMANLGCNNRDRIVASGTSGLAPGSGPRAEWDYTLLVSPPASSLPSSPRSNSNDIVHAPLAQPPGSSLAHGKLTVGVINEEYSPTPPELPPQVTSSVVRKSSLQKRQRHEGGYLISEEVTTEVVETTTVTVRVVSAERVDREIVSRASFPGWESSSRGQATILLLDEEGGRGVEYGYDKEGRERDGDLKGLRGYYETQPEQASKRSRL